MWPKTRRRPLDTRIHGLAAQEDAALRLGESAQEHGKSLAQPQHRQGHFLLLRRGQRRTGVEFPHVEVDRVVTWPVALHGL